MKICTICNISKDESQFSLTTRRRPNSQCKPCKSKWIRDYRRENKDIAMQTRKRYINSEKGRQALKRHKLKRKYKLTEEEHENLLKKYNYRCAICNTDTPGGNGVFHVDHDHGCCPSMEKTCGKCVRGILCNRCNLGIGYLKDDTAILNSAIIYLNTYQLSKSINITSI